MLVFHVLLCVFASTAYLIFYGTDNAFLVSIITIFFSHNIATSLCCCSVDYFMFFSYLLVFLSLSLIIYLFKNLCIYFYHRIKHSDMNNYIIFLKIKIFKSYHVWPNIVAIYVFKNWCSYSKWFSISSSWIHDICTFIPSNNHWVH